MNETCKLIYDFREHGLYYQNYMEDLMIKKFTLTIDTLQLECDYITGKLLSVSGFLPLFNAYRSFLKMPFCVEKELDFQTRGAEFISGMAYDFFKFYPDSKEYFIKEELPIITYDDKNKRILIGARNSLGSHNIQINKNIICTIDENKNLKALLLLLDEIIKE